MSKRNIFIVSGVLLAFVATALINCSVQGNDHNDSSKYKKGNSTNLTAPVVETKQTSSEATQDVNSEVSEVIFSDLSFEKAKEEAQKTGKLIFLDAYTTWCAPCKKMDRETFKEPKVAEYFNEHFINLHIDMERGEGILLSKQFNVEFYPSLFFIDANGSELKRAIGYHSGNQLIKVAKEVAGD